MLMCSLTLGTSTINYVSTILSIARAGTLLGGPQESGTELATYQS